MKLTWTNAPKVTPKDKIGFVYGILDLKNGKKYFGIKKLWRTIKKAPTKYKMKDGKWLKDKKGKRIINTRKTKEHIRVETDWRDYNGSGNFLDLIKKNPERFQKTIIKFCDSVTEMKLEEAWLQLSHWKNDEWDKLYNEEINLRLRVRKKG